jgi:hypothetical protein
MMLGNQTSLFARFNRRARIHKAKYHSCGCIGADETGFAHRVQKRRDMACTLDPSDDTGGNKASMD